MDIMYTSFGLGLDMSMDSNPFYRALPMIVNSALGGFQFDIAPLFLYDRLIINSNSIGDFYLRNDDTMKKFEDELAPNIKGEKEFLRILENEGFIKLVDFDAIVKANQNIVQEKVDKQLENLEAWVVPMKEALSIWKTLLAKTSPLFGNLHLAVGRYGLKGQDQSWIHVEASRTSSYEVALQLLEQRVNDNTLPLVRRLVSSYLSYIYSNLLITEVFQVPLLDWADFEPLYRTITNDMNAQRAAGEGILKLRELFNVFFPPFSMDEPKKLAKALTDKRVEALGNLVKESVCNNQDFDSEFAANTLSEVLGVEREIARRRSIVAWATKPLGFIPGIGPAIEIPASIVADKAWSEKPKEELPWYYLISDLTQ